MDRDELEEAKRASLRHFVADGVPELVSGSFVLLWGLAMVAEHVWPQGTWPSWLSHGSAAAGMLLAVLYLLTSSSLMRRLKEHLTYPRIGYAKPHPAPGSRRGGAMVIAVVTAVAMALWIRGGGRALIAQAGPLIMGALVALFAISQGLRLRLRRFWVYAAVSLVVGGLASWGCSYELGVGLVMCASGAAFIVGGALTMRRLLRMPPQAEA